MDYITKLIIGSLVVIAIAGILAGTKSATPVRNHKPVVPEVTYIRDKDGKIIGAASSVPYTKDGNIEQRPVEESILGTKEIYHED